MKLQIESAKVQHSIVEHEEQLFLPIQPENGRVEVLNDSNTPEVLEFLSKRPVHTIVMTGFILDNGIESPKHRGRFYAYRNEKGNLEGVALIGHTTLIEARSVNALAAFAHKAQAPETPIHLMMSDGRSIESFWKLFAGESAKPRLVCTELLFELTFPYFVQDCSWDLRLARPEELEQIAAAHAEVAFIECGVDPLQKDREGFLKRCLNRIDNERTFVVFENGTLVFKADIVSETGSAIYLEGIYVAPEYRGRGIGPKCLSKLCLNLLERVQNICLLSNVEFKNAHRSFEKAGFTNADECTTIFV